MPRFRAFVATVHDRQPLNSLFTIRSNNRFGFSDFEGVRVMAASNLEWLRDRLQDDRPRAGAGNPTGTGVASSMKPDEGATALELVYQAAEMIQGMTDRADDAEARARWIVENALSKLEAT
jgi:hypothetical protein